MADRRLPETLDVLIVGAGAAGLYLLHRLRGAGFRVKCVDSAGGVGGTWYWDRYPGARCDVESMRYSFGFDEDLQQDWVWTERYAPQPEILGYLEHVADRFDLRRDIELETRVTAARFDEDAARWRIETDRGDAISAAYCVMATGCLSAAKEPRIEGLRDFGGDLYWTARWPHEPVDFSGRRVGVIGTGSTGIQTISVIAEQAEHLFVFQRTPQYAVPARNRRLDPAEVRDIKAEYSSLRALLKSTPTGDTFSARDVSAVEVSDEERTREFEARWQEGGIGFMASFRDLVSNVEANRAAQEFVKAKIRATVEDPEVAERLCPDDIFGGRRLCLDNGYFETFNRPDVTLVDVATTPIRAVTPKGVDVGGTLYEIDALVLATGFDAMTGAL
ncbi:MAG: NAD(P)/FAD-dependent oxidoreductase, partial [Bauldia litoralis]